MFTLEIELIKNSLSEAEGIQLKLLCFCTLLVLLTKLGKPFCQEQGSVDEPLGAVLDASLISSAQRVPQTDIAHVPAGLVHLMELEINMKYCNKAIIFFQKMPSIDKTRLVGQG